LMTYFSDICIDTSSVFVFLTEIMYASFLFFPLYKWYPLYPIFYPHPKKYAIESI
jgi:hypothetical protein